MIIKINDRLIVNLNHIVDIHIKPSQKEDKRLVILSTTKDNYTLANTTPAKARLILQKLYTDIAELEAAILLDKSCSEKITIKDRLETDLNECKNM